MPTIAIGTGGITVSGQLLTLPLNVDPIEIDIDIEFEARVTGVPQDHLNDVTWYMDNDDAGIFGADPGVAIDLSGQPLHNTLMSNSFDIEIDVSGSAIAGGVEDGYFDIEIDIHGEWYSTVTTNNWVGWSKIGELSFVQDKSNESGFRPMDWPGNAWRVIQLGKTVMVYGSGGITVMRPIVEPVPSFGFDNMPKMGIKSMYSVCGTDHVHYFISTSNDLWKLTPNEFNKLGFAEFFAAMENPLLNYHEDSQKLFISDGDVGYVFADGLGGGYATLTGITKRYAVGSGALTPVPFSIMTDTIDLGHRGLKTVGFVEVGIGTSQAVYVAIDFRYSKGEAWRTSPWTLCNPEGVAKIGISCVEFRVRVKQVVYDSVTLDYINVRHQRPDKRFRRGPMFESSDQGGVI